MHIIVLNSGSNGNAVYVESDSSGAGVLLDCGISRRQVEQRLKVHGRFLQHIKGVFITHEHADHVRGLPVLTRQQQVPTYLTEGTFRSMHRNKPYKGHRFIRLGEEVPVEDIRVTAYAKNHDAADPVCFRVSIGEKHFLYVTDLGEDTEEIGALLGGADAALIESNYDVDMLEHGPYPPYLKARIRAAHGHLSNLQAMELLRRHANGRLHTLILGHLSENNNTPECVQKEVDRLLAARSGFRPRVVIASRFTVGEVLSL
ncbi:MAG: MBL fold metallo-hydrolase [Bacteroidota bacterium]|nr:MBL fold metallo-hydrolase [Bacteroidota bacterium]